MFKQVCLAVGSISFLSACSLMATFGYEPVDREPTSVATQDPHWQRFYELEKEIAELRKRLDKSPAQSSSSEPMVAAKATNTETDPNKTAEAFLQRLKGQTNKAKSVIDQAIVALDETKAVPEPTPEASYPRVAIAGNMHRDQEGEVVQQVTHTQPRQASYNYSVVYVYPEPKPWNEMWAKLELAQEPDKWRGQNPTKPSYFIYVGAYLKQEDALERQQSLLSGLGEGPELRVKHSNTALAAK